MTGPDVSKLSPSDCVAALRSYPRRFRAIVAPVGGDEKPDDLVHRAGADGRSALDHADHVARSIALLGQAMHQVLTQDQPMLPAAVLDDDAREWAVSGGALEADAVLDFVTRECEGLATSIDRVDASEWTRAGTIAGSGATVTAIAIAREAVRTGAEHLRAAEAAVEAARRK
jgi:hypothetical protein